MRIGRGRSEGGPQFWMFDFIFLIREKIAHAKFAKAAKARILDVGCFPAVAGRAYARILIGEEIAHAKPRQECGVEPPRTRRMEKEKFLIISRSCGTRVMWF